MKKIIRNVRQKPFKTRENIMWAASFVVFTLFAALWFVDFQSDSYALLNPQEVVEQQDSVLVENHEGEEVSPFAAILTALGDFKDKVTNSFSSDDNDDVVEEKRNPVTLPISD